jgi:hypothetical protein
VEGSHNDSDIFLRGMAVLETCQLTRFETLLVSDNSGAQDAGLYQHTACSRNLMTWLHWPNGITTLLVLIRPTGLARFLCRCLYHHSSARSSRRPNSRKIAPAYDATGHGSDSLSSACPPQSGLYRHMPVLGLALRSVSSVKRLTQVSTCGSAHAGAHDLRKRQERASGAHSY